MSRAQELFHLLKESGVTALDALIEDREPESLFLDFKQAPQGGQGARLTDSENKNIGMAISGFGNSEGGVLVFGVDCRPNADGREVATKAPIPNVLAFQGKFESAISRATIPPQSGVVTAAIFEPGNDPRSGYLAVLIPKATNGPVRSVSSSRYHLRTGSAFEIVGHDLLAGMFGRLPQPSISPNFTWYPVRQNDRRDALVFGFELVAINLGSVIAREPCIAIDYGALRADWIRVRPTAPLQLQSGTLPVRSVYGGVTDLVVPGGATSLCSVLLTIANGAVLGIQLKCTLSVPGASPVRFDVIATEERLRAAIDRTRDAPVGTQLPPQDLLEIIY